MLFFQSLTKFYDGHNVTVGGAIASSTKELNDKMHFYSNIHGNILRCADDNKGHYIDEITTTTFQKQSRIGSDDTWLLCR